MKRVILIAILVLPCLSCRQFWCWPFCQDAADEALTDEAKAKRCRDIGDQGPDGGHIKVYNECMRKEGLKP